MSKVKMFESAFAHNLSNGGPTTMKDIGNMTRAALVEQNIRRAYMSKDMYIESGMSGTAKWDGNQVVFTDKETNATFNTGDMIINNLELCRAYEFFGKFTAKDPSNEETFWVIYDPSTGTLDVYIMFMNDPSLESQLVISYDWWGICCCADEGGC